MPSSLLKALGRQIRRLRTERGYSQEQFADLCGVHRTFMGTVERGESNLSFQNMARIARSLNVPLAQLMAGLEDEAAELRKAKAGEVKAHSDGKP